ncbi:MAG: HyaD/HybD family hydrogenase maturation endopeptidase [Syntrophomonadaceae bacterium]|jgi:hydrogenase maturation protease
MIKNKPIILGLGNPLFRDEGLGIHLIHQLMQEGFHMQAELIDGGTDALSLLGIVENTDYLLVVDAIDNNLPAGTILQISGEEIPLFTTEKMSAHQIGFQDVLALASLRKNLPAHFILIGVQPESLDWGTDLTPPVAKTFPFLKNMIREHINSWNFHSATYSLP